MSGEPSTPWGGTQDHYEPQYAPKSYSIGEKPFMQDPMYRAPMGQFHFPPRPLQGSIQPEYQGQGSLSWEQEKRPTVKEQQSLIHVAHPGPRKDSSGKPAMFQAKRVRFMLALDLVLLAMALVLLFVSFRFLKNEQFKTFVDVPISGQPGRFDYQSLDPHTGLLFVSQPGTDSVLIFDTRSNKVVANVPGIKDAHGILVIPELRRVYISSAIANQVVVMDEQAHRVIATISTGAGPDGLAYDPVDQKLYVSDQAGHSDTVINVRTEKRIDIIPLGGEAGNTQYDPVSHRIFVNVQTLMQLVVIDPLNDQIVKRYPLSSGCIHNHGLNIDAVQRFAFIACDASDTLLMVDMHTMQVIDTATIAPGADVLALDTDRHILYVATEIGIVSAFDEHSNSLQNLAEGDLGPNAHTIAVDQQTHYIYLPLENVNGKSIMRVALLQS